MKVLSNKVLAWSAGVNEKNEPVEVKTVIGFSTLPDWVAETPYFKAAIMDGSIKAFDVPTFSGAEKTLADEEKKAYEAKIAELETQLASKNTEIPQEIPAKTKK